METQDVPGWDWFQKKLRARCPGCSFDRDELVHQAVNVIWENLCESLSVTSIVERLPSTRRTMERRFRQQLGCSIGEVNAFARLELAKWLLTETSWPINTVATKAGYSSSAWMGKVIRRSTGMTPGEYRRQAMAAMV